MKTMTIEELKDYLREITETSKYDKREYGEELYGIVAKDAVCLVCWPDE
jgi:threonyl-tRNA synthetase